MVSHDGFFCERFIDSASPWEVFGQKLVLNTKDPKAPQMPPLVLAPGDRDDKAGQLFLPGCAAGSGAVLGLWCGVTAICSVLLADAGTSPHIRSAIRGTRAGGVEMRGERPTPGL